jgi:hypothetical protein
MPVYFTNYAEELVIEWVNLHLNATQGRALLMYLNPYPIFRIELFQNFIKTALMLCFS